MLASEADNLVRAKPYEWFQCLTDPKDRRSEIQYSADPYSTHPYFATHLTIPASVVHGIC